MPKKVVPLTDPQIRNAKPKDQAYKISDGLGLYVYVSQDGAKLWRFDYAFELKRKTLSFGRYPEVCIVDARKKREQARLELAKGIDPGEKKREVKQKQRELKCAIKAGVPFKNSFKEVALRWFDLALKDKTPRHQSRAMAFLNNDLFPFIGERHIADIQASSLKECMKRVAERKNRDGNPVNEAVRRIYGLLRQIWSYAVSCDDIPVKHNIVSDIVYEVPKHKNVRYSHITDPKLLGQLVRDIENYAGAPVTMAALRILPMVFVRPGELRMAQWSEINMDKREWRYVASKTDEPHIVPLADQVIQELETLYAITGNGKYVFGVRGGGRPLSDGTLNKAIKSLGYTSEMIQPHGFRHTAATMLAELGWNENVIDKQLAHITPGVKGVYQLAKYLPERKRMMQAWADYVEQLKNGAKIIPLKAAN